MAGTCDTLANSSSPITNRHRDDGELHMGSFTEQCFPHQRPFLLTAGGTPGDHQVLTINGLFGVIEVRVKDQNGAQVLTRRPPALNGRRSRSTRWRVKLIRQYALPIMFTAVFSRAVTGFTASDLVITGMQPIRPS